MFGLSTLRSYSKTLVELNLIYLKDKSFNQTVLKCFQNNLEHNFD